MKPPVRPGPGWCVVNLLKVHVTTASTVLSLRLAPLLLSSFVFFLFCQFSQVTIECGARFWPTSAVLACAGPPTVTCEQLPWPQQGSLLSPLKWVVAVEPVAVKKVYQVLWVATVSFRPVLPRSVLTAPFFGTLLPHQTPFQMGLSTPSKGPYRNAQCRVFSAPRSWWGVALFSYCQTLKPSQDNTCYSVPCHPS